MSYTLSDARAWNASLKAKRPEISALFVGATSGIGEHTAKALAASIERPTIYIVGRNQEAGKRVTEELKNTNPQGTYVFLPADVSQFKNVDEVCQQIQAREKALDLLFLSTGTIAFKKQESKSGIDVNHLIRYYSRMRFIHNLLPTLKAAKSPRVVSVLAGGQEAPVDEGNLDLTKNFSLSASFAYPATMTSAAFEFLAEQNPSISFIHEYPGFVTTPLLKTSLGSILGTIFTTLLTPMSISAEQSGEWNVFLSTSPRFPSKDPAKDSASADQKIPIAKASTSTIGGGSYIVNYKGEDSTKEKFMAELRDKGFPKTMWDHTLSTFDTVISSEKAP